jgi:drug/metabolite transporter (DMT)-like permease
MSVFDAASSSHQNHYRSSTSSSSSSASPPSSSITLDSSSPSSPSSSSSSASPPSSLFFMAQKSPNLDDRFDAFGKVKLVFILIGWYLFSSLSNNLNKTILKLHPYPVLLTGLQFLFIAIYTFLLLQIMRRKIFTQITTKKITHSVLPLSFGHIFAHLFTQISIGKMAVSFTHTVKASSPVFTVILSRIYLGESFTAPVLGSLVPIIFGVFLSSATELEFDVLGFTTALFSTFIFSAQNIFSKKLFREYQFDHIELMFFTSSCSFFIMLPLLLFFDEGLSILVGSDPNLFSSITTQYFLNGVCHFMQNILGNPYSCSHSNIFSLILTCLLPLLSPFIFLHLPSLYLVLPVLLLPLPHLTPRILPTPTSLHLSQYHKSSHLLSSKHM